MTINDRMRQKLAKRDPYCLHCGEENDLVIHHRKNRGMGGSKLLDHYPNLLRVCAVYNGRMESEAVFAQEAKEFGHKLESWQDFSDPVYDRCTDLWYVLHNDGTKEIVDGPEVMF